ncbi:MAG: hypothetical protein H3C64_03425 [Candidatus Kuenenia stuttgartiensis]|nr:hypothetical protein [Candidatus Kuenenia stuttgartiensis]
MYNEAGMQHELALYLRQQIGDKYIIRLEYPIGSAGISERLAKKEMDIYLQHRTTGKKYCIELKHTQGRSVPNRMFQAFTDVLFLEQLKEHGFDKGFLLFFTNGSRFWQEGQKARTLYQYFRGDRVTFSALYKTDDIQEFISKKTDNKILIPLKHTYAAKWQDFMHNTVNGWRYFIVEL